MARLAMEWGIAVLSVCVIGPSSARLMAIQPLPIAMIVNALVCALLGAFLSKAYGWIR